MVDSTHQSSVPEGNEAECGCSVPGFEHALQGMEPESEAAIMQPTTSITSTTTTLTVGSDVRPLSVTFTFPPDSGQAPHAGPDNQYIRQSDSDVDDPMHAPVAPSSVVRIMDGKSVVTEADPAPKIPVDGARTQQNGDDTDTYGQCYLNDDGHCPACGV